MKRHTGLILFGALLLVLSMSVSATAAKLITSKQIKNNSVKSIDIKDGTLNLVDLSPAARAALQGHTGPAGPAGAAGQNGTNGTDGLPLVGSARTRPGDVAGTVELQVESGNGTMTFICATPDLDPDPVDPDGDTSFPPADCDDEDATVHPGAEEVPDGKDTDCDGSLGTGFPASNTPDVGACRAGTQDETTEGPTFPGPITGAVLPVAEIPDNNVDDDCDGETDEQ